MCQKENNVLRFWALGIGICVLSVVLAIVPLTGGIANAIEVAHDDDEVAVEIDVDTSGTSNTNSSTSSNNASGTTSNTNTNTNNESSNKSYKTTTLDGEGDNQVHPNIVDKEAGEASGKNVENGDGSGETSNTNSGVDMAYLNDDGDGTGSGNSNSGSGSSSASGNGSLASGKTGSSASFFESLDATSIIGGVAIVAVIVVAIIAFLVLRERRTTRKDTSAENDANEETSGEKPADALSCQDENNSTDEMTHRVEVSATDDTELLPKVDETAELPKTIGETD